MLNKCVVATCHNSKESTADAELHTFHFPSEVKRPDLHDDWVRFVNRCNGWNPSSSSVICHHHFDEKYLIKGTKWMLRWMMQPAPTIYPEKLQKTPSVLPTQRTHRKPPTERIFQEDECGKFILRPIKYILLKTWMNHAHLQDFITDGVKIMSCSCGRKLARETTVQR